MAVGESELVTSPTWMNVTDLVPKGRPDSANTHTRISFLQSSRASKMNCGDRSQGNGYFSQYDWVPSGHWRYFLSWSREWFHGCLHILKIIYYSLKIWGLFCLLLVLTIRNQRSSLESLWACAVLGRGYFCCFFALVSFPCQLLRMFVSLHLIVCDFNKGHEVSHSARLTTFLVLGSPPHFN